MADDRNEILTTEGPNPSGPVPTDDLPPKPPAAPAKPVTAAQTLKEIGLAAYDSETVELVNAQVQKVDEADKEFHEINEEAKGLKKVWEARQEELTKLIKERAANRGKPVQPTLLDVIEPPAPRLGEPGLPDPLAELWRQFPLSRLSTWGATANDLLKLTEGVRKDGPNIALVTMGDMADYTANPSNPGYERRLTDFKGIGPAAFTRIEEATGNFWGWWNSTGQAEFAAEQGLTHARNPEGDGAEGDGGGGPGDDGQPLGPGDLPDAEDAAEGYGLDVAGADEAA